MADASECFHDTAAAAGFSDEKLRKVNLHESPHMFCDVYGLQPGQSQKIHAHAGSDKIYHGLTGSAQVTIGDVVREIGPGQLAVAPDTVRSAVPPRTPPEIFSRLVEEAAWKLAVPPVTRVVPVTL